MKNDMDQLLEDLSLPENVEKARAILARHVEFLQARLEDERDDMSRQILQARIDNLVLAQKQLEQIPSKQNCLRRRICVKTKC